jgi:hypothetical protein
MKRSRLSRKAAKPRGGRLAVDKLKNEINDILYRSDPAKFPDHQLIRVVVRSDKAKHLAFLKGFTEWRAIGTWQDYPDEHNTVIEVVYREDANESNGKRLKALFDSLNKAAIGEERLFMITLPVEISSV